MDFFISGGGDILNTFWKGAKNHKVIKVIKSKNDGNENCLKF